MNLRKAFVKRMLTFSLCLAMVFTSVNVPALTVMAANETVSDNAVALETVSDNNPDNGNVSDNNIGDVSDNDTEEGVVTDTEPTVLEDELTESVVEDVVLEEVPEDANVPALAEGYTQFFYDGFNGEDLDTTKWTREVRPSGWTNKELQAYVDSEDNAYVANGNLVLQAIKNTDGEGTTTYTSGKINSQNKVDFTYGKVEARLKTPTGGQGLWPAFWMMPTNEKFYGTWPKCGEIDIMEVLCQEPAKGYQTIHFGEPHMEAQGTKILTEGTFSSDYHIWAVEWLPGKMIFTIDGEIINEVDDWYTKVEGGDEVTFPAPFDQDFFLQFNLAVGGSWPGNPDETTLFGDDAQLLVDWVRVSRQSDEAYEELLSQVEQPDRSVQLRDPDANGNYVVNGDFSVEEALNETNATTAGVDWVFLTADGGEGTASIDTTEGVLTIDTTNESASEQNQTYSIQLVQPGLPMEQGKEYKLSFTAKADEARTMIVDISNTSTWSRYLNDTTLNLTTEWADYDYTFSVTDPSDENARLEFNLGKQDSIATTYLKDVKLVQTGNTVEIEDAVTTPDGNYVRNGGFEVGENRLGYWTVNTGETEAVVSVTNVKNAEAATYVRELKVVGAEGLTAEDVSVSQTGLALAANTEYEFTLNARAEAATTVKVVVAGVEKTIDLTTENTVYPLNFTTSEELSNKNIVLYLGSETTVYMDNISIKDTALIKNGSFDQGSSGWTPFKDGTNAASVTYGVEEVDGDNVMKYSIPDTGKQEWYIQLKQHNVKIENGKTYKLTFNAKSTVDRNIQFAFQRNGELYQNANGEQDWTPYSETEIVAVTNEWQEYSTIFTMTEPTDTTTIMAVTLGAVGGVQVATPHDIYLDDFVLVETEPPVEAVTGEMIQNGDFVSGTANWEGTEIYTPATGTVDFANGKAVYNITSLADAENWNVQLKQNGLTLAEGKTYRVKFDITSSAARDVKWALLDPENGYNWYSGETLELSADTVKAVDFSFTVPTDGSKPSSDTVQFQITMSNDVKEYGATPAENTYLSVPEGAHTIEIDNVSVQMVEESGSEVVEPVTGEMIKNNNFADGAANWETTIGQSWAEGSAGEVNLSADGAVFDITSVGISNWNVQLKQTGLTLIQGEEYKVKVVLAVENTRDVQIGLLNSENAEYFATVERVEAGEDVATPANVVGTTIEKTMTMNSPSDGNVQIQISMGNVGELSPTGRVVIKSVSVQMVEGTQTPEPTPTPTPSPVEADEMLTNSNFANGKEGWVDNTEENWTDSEASATYGVNGAEFDITDVGSANYMIQMKQGGLTLEKDKAYTIKVVAETENDRYFDFSIMNADSSKWYGGATKKLDSTKTNEVKHTFMMNEETNTDAWFLLSLGQNQLDTDAGVTTPAGKVTIKSVSITPAKDRWVKAIDDQIYTGSAIKPVIEVYDGNRLLTEKKDYTVSYKNNKTVGTATVTVTGKGSYKEKTTTSFEIVAKDITTEGIDVATLYNTTLDKNGKFKAPKVTIKYGKTTLKEGTEAKPKDYIITWTEDKTAGYNKEVTITGTGNYKGTKTVYVDILPYGTVWTSKAKVTVDKISYADYVAGVRPTITVKNYAVDTAETVGDYNVVWPSAEEVNTGKNNQVLVEGVYVTGTNSEALSGKLYGSTHFKFELTGTKLNAKDLDIALAFESEKYTGEELKPDVIVKDLKRPIEVEGEEGEEPTTDYYEMVRGKDYTVSYAKNTDAGTAQVIITGKGAYEGSVKKTFKITKVDLSVSANTVVVDVADQVYTGKALKPAVAVTVNGRTLGTKEYSVKYSANKNVGTGKVVITGKGNYTGKTAEVPFAIVAKAIGNEGIIAEEMQIPSVVNATLDKNGKFKAPKVAVKYGKTTLKEGTAEKPKDYIITWPEDLTAGYDKLVTITGTGNYSGTYSMYVDILPYGTTQASKAKVTVPKMSYADYVAGNLSTVTVKNFVAGTDYVIEWPSVSDVTTGKNNVVTIRGLRTNEVVAEEVVGTGKLYGVKEVKFELTGTKLSTSKTAFEITGVEKVYPYANGAEVRPEIAIKDIKANKQLNLMTAEAYAAASVEAKLTCDGIVSYEKNKEAGTGKVVVNGVNAYTGKITVSFKIDKQGMDQIESTRF